MLTVCGKQLELVHKFEYLEGLVAIGSGVVEIVLRITKCVQCVQMCLMCANVFTHSVGFTKQLNSL